MMASYMQKTAQLELKSTVVSTKNGNVPLSSNNGATAPNHHLISVHAVPLTVGTLAPPGKTAPDTLFFQPWGVGDYTNRISEILTGAVTLTTGIAVKNRESYLVQVASADIFRIDIGNAGNIKYFEKRFEIPRWGQNPKWPNKINDARKKGAIDKLNAFLESQKQLARH